jgi:hypothetical protein
MTVPSQPSPLSAPFHTRFLAAVAVTLFTYVAWVVLWAAGAAAFGLASALSRRPMPRSWGVGELWQWVVAASTLALVVSLLAASPHARVAAWAWFAALIGLAILSAFLIQLDWTIPVAVAVAVPLLAWVHFLAQRAA